MSIWLFLRTLCSPAITTFVTSTAMSVPSAETATCCARYRERERERERERDKVGARFVVISLSKYTRMLTFENEW